MSRFSSPHELYRAYGKRAKKRFGQHFLTDYGILSRVAGGAEIDRGDKVLEIGPGCGTLTWTLMSMGADVTAVELDRDLAGFLREMLVPEGLKLVEGDILELDLDDILEGDGWKVVANLPYNVATPITMALLDSGRFQKMSLMYQKEVAQRLVASAGDDAYGSLSLAIELRADAQLLFTLAPGAFTPPPKVESAVVALQPVEGTRIEDDAIRATFEQAVRGAFMQRRKTLPNGLRNAGFDKKEARRILESLEIDPRTRPEALSFSGWVKLARGLSSTDG